MVGDAVAIRADSKLCRGLAPELGREEEEPRLK